ncbi:LacI family DNA-binding transcriptional regulator [Herbiconiux sp. VKM Ac-2851]|uniref:LacI family DNA-binding transcriptional regulator n=1 Tax=Herbiconiux sp. VKM Ac-2851 TaxID=2739025 RepID=UPI001566477C|nr:LacI family DNA-binding transcriptional regulator [Herbiconiux sp. VKM Ac-2851]NQX35752.1 LacI family DNA-binding transcriptional regulator [Herbiconiux sp. VKM Ac-2851]
MADNGSARPAVIADVAKLAGVSVPTVSRVLTGAARVTPEKVRRVREAIEQLNYRPSATARALASRHSHTIAIVAGNTSQYGYAETIRGIEEEARADGYTVTITVVESPGDEEVSRAVSLVLDQSPAGVVVLKFDPPGVAVLNRLPRDTPVVAISGVRSRDVPQAVLDELHAAETLTEYLLSLGHATVHHVRVPPSRKEDGRTTGWRRALARAGAEIVPPFEASWSPESGRRIGREIAHDPGVTAVFCGNDEIAMGVIKGLSDEGVAVPRDVSVVGFDDHPLAAMWSPALTTVEQDFVGLGRRGVELLRGAMSGDERRRTSTELPQLVIRDSAGPPAARR